MWSQSQICLDLVLPQAVLDGRMRTGMPKEIAEVGSIFHEDSMNRLMRFSGSSRERDRDRDLKRRRHRSSRSRSPPRRRHVAEGEQGKPPYHEAGGSRSRRDDQESARPPRNRPSPESRSPRRRDSPLLRPPMGRRSPPRVSRSQSPNSAERDDRKKLEPDFKPSGAWTECSFSHS